MNYHLSDYELNARDPDAIVYKDAYGNITRLTRADFSSEAEFQKWKKISDDDLHKSHRRDHVEEVHTVSLFQMTETGALSTPSAEDIFFEGLEREERRRQLLETLSLLQNCLSKVQYRRTWLRLGVGLSIEDIADKERVSKAAVYKSLVQAQKIMKPLGIFFKDFF